MAIFMNTETLKNWNAVKWKLKERYPELEDADLVYEVGREDELLRRIEQRTGRPRREIESFLEGQGDAARRAAGGRDWHEKRIEEARPRGNASDSSEPTAGTRQVEGRDPQRGGNASGSTAPSSRGQPGTAGEARESQGSTANPSREKPARAPQPGAERMRQRVQPPGEAGLANESRPGLGSRSSEQEPPEGEPGASEQPQAPNAAPREHKEDARQGATSGQQPRPAAVPRPPTAPEIHEPREQQADSFEQQQERSTGVSGHTSGS
jgi:hypothetical protein